MSECINYWHLIIGTFAFFGIAATFGIIGGLGANMFMFTYKAIKKEMDKKRGG